MTATRVVWRGYGSSDRVRCFWPDSQIDDASSLIWYVIAGIHRFCRTADQPVSAAAVRQFSSGELPTGPRELIIIRTSGTVPASEGQ
ncbi:hypothetical protein ACLB1Q_26165 [Escherichia coli]